VCVVARGNVEPVLDTPPHEPDKARRQCGQAEKVFSLTK